MGKGKRISCRRRGGKTLQPQARGLLFPDRRGEGLNKGGFHLDLGSIVSSDSPQGCQAIGGKGGGDKKRRHQCHMDGRCRGADLSCRKGRPKRTAGVQCSPHSNPKGVLQIIVATEERNGQCKSFGMGGEMSGRCRPA